MTPSLLLLGLMVAVTASNTALFFAPAGSKGAYSEVMITSTVTVALILAIVLSYRQVLHNHSHAKSYLSLAAGLILWFCADVIWASYDLVYHVAAPIPSLPDALWLAGYPFFAYNLFATFREFRSKSSRRVLLAGIVGNAIFLAYLIPLTASLSDFTTQQGLLMFAVLAAYPVMNAVLTIPALPILAGLWKDRPWSIPWMFKALSLFCIVATDSWFAFVMISGLYEQAWVSSMLFGAEYLLLSGGLLWFNKFLPVYKNHGKDRDAKPVFGGRSSAKVRYIQVMVTVVLMGGIVSYGFVTSMATKSAAYVLPAEGNPVLIGALLPLTGTRASYAEEYEAALNIAMEDVNEHLAESGSENRIGLIIEDTRTDPEVALEKLKVMASRGIQIVIGPATSAEVAAVKQYADENNILIVSMSSTAPSLAIPGDNVFRLVPDDTHQSNAIVRQMWDDGVRVVVPMWRTDVFGNNLQKLLSEEFEKRGGTVTGGVGYSPPVGDFAASLQRINFIVWEQELRAVKSQVNEAVQLHGAANVGVYVVAFDEIVPILLQAGRHPALAEVRWYGSDGSAQHGGVINNADAAGFAVKTNFLNPIYGGEKTERLVGLEAEIADMTGRAPRSYAAATYDSLWVAALALENRGEGGSLRDAFLQSASSYSGVTGSTELNDAGDRKSGSYDLWAVRSNGDEDSFQWTNVATREDSGSLVLVDAS